MSLRDLTKSNRGNLHTTKNELNIFRQPERIDFLTPHGFDFAHAKSLKTEFKGIALAIPNPCGNKKTE